MVIIFDIATAPRLQKVRDTVGPRTRAEGEAPGCPSRALVATFGFRLAAFLWSLFTSGSRTREPEVKARLPVVPLGLCSPPKGLRPSFERLFVLFYIHFEI